MSLRRRSPRVKRRSRGNIVKQLKLGSSYRGRLYRGMQKHAYDYITHCIKNLPDYWHNLFYDTLEMLEGYTLLVPGNSGFIVSNAMVRLRPMLHVIHVPTSNTGETIATTPELLGNWLKVYIEANAGHVREEVVIFDFGNTGVTKKAIKRALEGYVNICELFDDQINTLLSPQCFCEAEEDVRKYESKHNIHPPLTVRCVPYHEINLIQHGGFNPAFCQLFLDRLMEFLDIDSCRFYDVGTVH